MGMKLPIRAECLDMKSRVAVSDVKEYSVGFAAACRLVGGEFDDDEGLLTCRIPVYDSRGIVRGSVVIDTWAGRGTRVHSAHVRYLTPDADAVVDFGRLQLGGDWSSAPLDMKCREEIRSYKGVDERVFRCSTVDDRGNPVPNGFAFHVIKSRVPVDHGKMEFRPVAVGIPGSPGAVHNRPGFSKGFVWIYSD